MTLTTEQIHEITDRALEEGRIPSSDAGDDQGQPLLTLAVRAAIFGLTLEQAEAERTEFFPPIAEVAFLGPIRPAWEDGTVNSRM